MRAKVSCGWSRGVRLLAVAVAFVVLLPAAAFADSPSIALSGQLAAAGNGESVSASGASQITAAVSEDASGISTVGGSFDSDSVTASSSTDIPCGSATDGCSGSVSWDFGSAATVGWHTFSVTATDDDANEQTASEPLAIVGAPTVSGTEAVGQTLTAVPAALPGSMPSGAQPLTYSFQWESCDPTGASCTTVTNATGSTYTLSGSDVGSELEVIESVTVPGQTTPATVSSAATSLIEPADGDTCTESWIPDGGGTWDTASNWSGGTVPDSSDVVCIRGGAVFQSAPTIDSDATVGELQAGGADLTVDNGATLTISSTSADSTVGTLNLGDATADTAGSLSVAGDLKVGQDLSWISGAISGGGTITLAGAANSVIEPQTSSDSITLNDTELVNDGSLDLYCSTANDSADNSTLIEGENGATLDNTGFLDYWDPSGSSPAVNCELQQGSGSPSTLTNTGGIYGSGTSSWSSSLDVGWTFDDSASSAQVDYANINLFGGESAPLAGSWENDDLNLESGGSYSVSDDLADFGAEPDTATDVTVGAAPGSSGAPTTDYTNFLAGTTTAPSMSVTAGEWQNGSITADGPLTLGQDGAVVTVGNVIDSDAAPITIDGTVNAATYTGDDGDLTIATGATFDVYGSTGLTGEETVSGGSGSTVDFEGPLDVAEEPSISTSGGLVLDGTVSGTGNLSVTVGGPFSEQGGIDITGDLSIDSTDNSDIQLAGAITAGGTVSLLTGGRITTGSDGSISATELDAQAGSGITIGSSVQVSTATLSSPESVALNGWWDIDAGTLTLTGGGTITNDDVITVDTLIVSQAVFVNEIQLNLVTELLAEDGAQVINDGLIDASGVAFIEGAGAASQLINTSGGTLSNPDPSNPNFVALPYSGTGTISPGFSAGGPITDVSGLTAPSCTDSWTGPSAGHWDDASNWSTGAVPTSTDVVCVSTASQITLADDSTAAQIFAPAATFLSAGGELQLTSGSETSQIGALEVNRLTLNAAGPVEIINALDWTAGTITGAGIVTLDYSADSTIAPTIYGDSPTLDAITLTNDGSLSVDCTSATDELGAAELVGTNGASITNSGTIELGTGGSQLCAFTQGSGTASQVVNSGTIDPQAADFIGWQFQNTADGSVTSSSTQAAVVLAGGEVSDTPEAGTWSFSDLYLAAGSYSFPTPTTVDISGLSVGLGSGDGDAFATLIDGTDAAAELTAPAVDWPTTTLSTYSGTTTIGSTTTPSSLYGLVNSGGTQTLSSPTSDASSIGADDDGSGDIPGTSGIQALAGTTTLYGTINDDGGSVLAVGNINSGAGPDVVRADYFYGTPETYPAADLYNEGTLNLYQWGVMIGLNGVLHQDGTTNLEPANSETFTQIVGIVYPFTSGAAPLMTGSGTTTFQNIEPSSSWEFDCADIGELTVSDQTFVNDITGCDLSSEQDVFKNVQFENYGNLDFSNGDDPVKASGSTEFDNYGDIEAAAKLFSYDPSQGKPSLVNEASGSLTDGAEEFGPNLVTWSFTNSGYVQPDSYIIDDNGDYFFGGGNPANPNAITNKCGDPVVCSSGDQTEQETDLSFGGLGGLSLVRTYNSQLATGQMTPGMFGYGWTSSFDAQLSVDSGSATATVEQPNGSIAGFTINTDGTFAPDEGIQATLTENGDGTYTYTLPDQESYVFGSTGNLESMSTSSGVTTTLQYNPNGQLTSVTAASGRQLTFTYNDEGLVATATDPAGLVVSYAYDDSDNLVSVSDSAGPAAAGYTWQFGYDDSHELTSMTNADEETTTIEYSAGQVISQTDPMNRTTTWSYSAGETLVTSPAGNETQYLWNSEGEPVSTTRGYGTSYATTTATTYDDAGEPTAVTDGNGQTTTYGYDSAGNRTSETDPDSHTTSWTYDSNRNVLTETLPSGKTTTSVYNSQNLPTSVATSATGVSTETSSTIYNSDGEPTSSTDARGKTTSYTYDSHGDLASVTDPLGNETTYGYDADGRKTSMVAPAGNMTGADPSHYTNSYGYDALGDLTSATDPDGGVTTYTYDPDQLKLSVEDPDNNTTSYAYNADGELTTTTLPDETTRTTTYDGDGNQLTQTNGNSQTTTYTYTPLDQLETKTDPLSRETSYTYDLDGNVATVTDPDSRTTTYGYNNEDQRTSVSYSDGVTPSVSYGYNPDGLVTSMTDGTGTTSYTYDGLDRLTSETNGDTQEVGYGYNADDQVTAITYPNGHTVDQTYDDDGRVATVSDWLGNTTGFAYDADSNLQTTSFPTGTDDTDTYSYNDADELTGVAMNQGTTALASIDNTLDAAGLITEQDQTGLPGTADTSYTYTADDQLATAGSSGYGYDSDYDPTEVDNETGYSYDDANELTASPTSTYGYDDLGERTSATDTGSDATTGYGYDQAGELTTVTPALGDPSTYTYDGTGELASASTGSSTSQFAWNTTASNPELLTDGSTSYIYGPDDLPVEQIDSGGTVSYLHHDQVGSTRLITDASGDSVGTFSYSPYGTMTASTGTVSTDLGYAGQYTDPTTGFEYDQARWYDPDTAAFITVDPAEQTTGQPYSYADDDPITNTDPSGLMCDLNPFSSGGGCLGDAVNGLGDAVSWEANQLSAGVTYVEQDPPRGIGFILASESLLTGGAEAAGALELITDTAAQLAGRVSFLTGIAGTADDSAECLQGKALNCAAAVSGGAGVWLAQAENTLGGLAGAAGAFGLDADDVFGGSEGAGTDAGVDPYTGVASCS
jgi:RHS repeat-associated protein